MKNLISIILIILSLGLGFMYIRPQYQTISDLRTKKAEYEDALAKAKEVNALKESLMQQYNAVTDADKTKLNTLIPDTFDLAKLSNDISNLAAQRGLAVSNFKASDQQAVASRSDIVAPPPTGYKITSVSFTTTGQYQNFLAFIKDVETDVELMDVQKIDVGESRVSKGVLDFQVTMNTYSTK